MAKATDQDAAASEDDLKDTPAEVPVRSRRDQGPPTKVRITKVGAGKVFTGRHLPPDGDDPGGPEKHEKNAQIVLPRRIAEELEDRNFVEILEDDAA